MAREFAALTQYHGTFRSCNRAFHIDPAHRLDHWCGHCDKCCFIDLILAPFLPAADLAAIFGGAEPLADPALAERFRALLGTSVASKPFECVGEVGECRAAAVLAAARPDRADSLPPAGPGRAVPAASPPPRSRRCSARPVSTGSLMRTRPTISWSDLRGARAGVWGLGVEGLANLRKLATLGVAAGAGRRPSRRRRAPAGSRSWPPATAGSPRWPRCDVVVKSPGISRYRPEVAHLAASGIPVVGGLGLWLAEADRGRVVCVTGTKGKSSTTAVAGHLLNRWGYRCLVGGNIGQPPWDPAAQGDGYDYWVIETSSYQATDLPCSPPVVAVTSLHPDHLDWHGDVETYYAGQAVGLLPAGRGPDRRERGQRPAAGTGGPARAAGGVGAGHRRSGRRLDGAARPARDAQPAQRADRPRLPARARRAGGRGRRRRWRKRRPASSRCRAG